MAEAEKANGGGRTIGSVVNKLAAEGRAATLKAASGPAADSDGGAKSKELNGVVYKPRGSSGYTCRLDGDGGLSVAISWEGSALELEVSPSELPTRALVGAVQQFAENEFGRRRARTAEQRRHNEKQAAGWREEAERISELLGDLSDTTQEGWCSACLTQSTHRLVASRTMFGTRQYICSECGSPTGWCDVPKCDHFANRSDMPRGSERFCAEHGHQIPSFAKLSQQVGSLDEYQAWLEFESINASRVSTVAGASVVGITVVAPLAFFAAPAIGGAIGAWSGLSGAAATSHGLALLGGGSIAAGGSGMFGGAIVVAAAGGVGIGGPMGASVAASYVRSDKSFGFDKVADGDGPTVVFANGFLSEGKTGWGDWERLIGERYPDATVYRLTWGAKELKALGVLAGQQLGATAAKAGVEKLAVQASKGAGKLLGPLSGVLLAAGVAKNPWHVARSRATMTGSVLADAIVRADVASVVLVGFSLGARVMVAAAESLATRHGETPRIESMHLLGAAVGTNRDWRAIGTAVSGTVWNYWSEKDFTLRYLYKAAEAGKKAVGCEGIPTRSPRIKNVNVSRSVPSHMSHLKTVVLR